MRRISKNKKAFTLVEIMLAIAIMMLVMPCIAMLLATIVRANEAVFNKNDVVDYAYANRLALEGYLANASTLGNGDQIISTSNGVITINGNPLVDVTTYFAHPNGTQTWDAVTKFTVSGTGVVDYEISYYLHGTSNALYVDEGTIYIPHMNPTNCAAVSGTSLLFSN